MKATLPSRFTSAAQALRAAVVAPALMATVLAIAGSAPTLSASGKEGGSVLPKMMQATSGPERELKQGMKADVVTRIMGAPAEISPMESPSGRAEVWVYRTVTKETTSQIDMTPPPMTVMVKGADGVERPETTTSPTILRIEARKTVRTTSLLMFNGALLNMKISEQEQREYR
jgi:hypothetical protein